MSILLTDISVLLHLLVLSISVNNANGHLKIIYLDHQLAGVYVDILCFQISLGLLKFGFITIYLSDPLTRALLMAAAVYVVTSQLGLMLGISLGNFSGPLNLIYVSFLKLILQCTLCHE
jgi:MFS superfamily sulfate permease-like transporter